jgi:anaerobic nitric oxide reductase transcription regulator
VETPQAGGPLRGQVDDFQRRLLREAVERNRGNQAAAARELGMHRANFHHLARRLGIKSSPTSS